MRIIITVALLIAISIGANAQRIVPIGGSRTTDTGLIVGSLKVDSVLVLPAYRTTNENIVLGFDSRGKAVLRINNDSLIYATRRYVDSGFNSISAGSVDSSIYSTVTRLADSLHDLRNYVDSNNTIIYGSISALYDTLPNYVPYTGATTDLNFNNKNITNVQKYNNVRISAIDSSTIIINNGATFTVSDDAIISGTNTGDQDLSGYVDTAMLNDSLQAVKALINLKQNYSDTTTWDATRYWVSTQIPSSSTYVPYTGATTDLNLGTNNILTNSVRLSASPTGTLTNVGQLYFDATNVTPSIPLNANVTLQIGQEEHVRARNNTGVQINDGQVVYINSAQGNNPTIALANADSVNTSEVIGVATENIADNGTGFITTYGTVNGINTSAFNVGDVLYLSATNGTITNVIPTPPHNVVKIGVALNDIPNGKIFVKPSQAIGQDTTFAAPYNSNKVAPTQRAIGTYVRKIVRDTASALRTAINAKGSGTVTSIQLVGGTNVTITPTTAITTSGVYTISATSGGGGSPTTATSQQVLYKSGSDTLKGATRVLIDSTDGRLVLSQNTDTASVSAYFGGGTKIVGINRMGMSAIRLVDTVSIPAALQRAMNAQNTSTIVPINANYQTTNSYSFYTANPNYVSNLTLTNNFAAYNATIQRFGYNYAISVTSASAGQNAGIYSNSLASAYGLICGNTKFSGGGGRGTFTFCLPTYLGTQRIFIGYSTATLPLAGLDPSALTFGSGSTPAAIIGIGKDAADGTLQFMHSVGGTGATTTKVSTGITANSENVYRVTVYVAPNSTFYIQLEVLSKTGTTTHILNPTTNVPAVETKLVSRQLIGNGLSGGVIQFGFINHMEEIY